MACSVHSIKGHVVRMSLVNSNATAVTGEGKQSGIFNFFIGRDQSRWATGVRSYSEAVAAQPYDGISLRYSIESGAPRYDLIVQPGADLSQFGMKIEGAEGARVLDNGNLQLDTSLGSIEEGGLNAYQQTPSGKVNVPCRMVLDGNVLRFDIGAYDAGKPLIMDPVVYSTYLGGSSGSDTPNAVTTDAANNIYVVGQTASLDFPATTGAYQTVNKDKSGNGTAFITKLNSSESSLIFSTFLGGTNGDDALSVSLDPNLDVYVAGYTASNDFPTTAGVIQPSYKETDSATAGFVTELSPSGAALEYSTYLGGSGDKVGDGDRVLQIAVNQGGDAYVVGDTFSANFPVTKGAYQTADKEPAETEAGFAAKLGAGGGTLLYGTYLSGTGDGNGNGDEGSAIAVDGAGNAFIAGSTFSSDFFPVGTPGFQSANNAVAADGPNGFVLKLNPAGTAIGYGTYLGGSTADYINSIALDSGDNATVAGYALSTDFPTTAGALMVSDPEGYVAGSTAGFVSRLGATGKALEFSTYLGGSGGFDAVYGLKLDVYDDVILTGVTDSGDFPVTAGALQTVNGNSFATGWVSELKSGGASLLYSTFLGGSGNGAAGDACYGLAYNSVGHAVITGVTTSSDFPTTGSAYDPYPASGFVTTLSLSSANAVIADFTVSPNPLPSGATGTGTISLSNSVSSDTVFTLTGMGPALLPASLTIPAGFPTGSFQFTAQGVNSTSTFQITATSGSLSKMVELRITPAILKSFALGQSAVLGGTKLNATVTLSGPAGSPDTPVALAVSAPSVVTVPSSVSVEGGDTAAKTTVSTIPLSADVVVTLTATLGSTILRENLAIRAARVALLTLPASAVGGSNVTATITLSSPAGKAGDVIALSSTSADAVVPKTVTVPPGATSATFNIATKAVSTTATITAAFEGESKSAALTISS